MKIRSIYIDELPDRCGREIRRHFRKNGNGQEALAIRERNDNNRRIWQVYFVPSDEVLKRMANDRGRFYLVERQIQHSLPFEWERKEKCEL